MAGMGLVLTVEVGGQEFENLEKAFSREADALEQALEGSAKQVSRELLKGLQKVYQRLAARHGTPWSGDMSGQATDLYKRTGGGLKGIRESIEVNDPNALGLVAGRISARFPMSVHEKGATIRPKRAQYLTIPLPAAMDSRGVPLRKRARDWDNTFVARSRKGNLLIFRKEGRGIVPLYVLKKEVRIPPRLGMEKDMRENFLPYFEKKAFEAISDQFDRIFSGAGAA